MNVIVLKMELSIVPKDIFRDIILPYAYRPQPIELINDIKSYYKTIHNVKNIYTTLYPTRPSTPEEESSSAWLSNDIARFLNDDQPTMYGYVTFYIQTYKRMYMNQSKDTNMISQTINRYEFASPSKHINTSIGLLTTFERSCLERFLSY